MDGIENLNPIQPGEKRNPKGINGFTYRDDAERCLAKWCKENGDTLIERLLEDAAKGKGWAMKLALDRILPAVQKHEIHLPEADPASLDAWLSSLDAKRRANGNARGNGSADSASDDRGEA